MASTLAPAPSSSSAPSPTRAPKAPAGRRAGYVATIVVNAVMLWIAHQLLDWEWPGFLTDEFGAVLPLLSVSLVATMVTNACYVAYDRDRFRALGDLVTAGISVAVGLLTWIVFPFDFAGYGSDWSWLVRLVLVLGIVGTSIAVLVNFVKLLLPTRSPAG